MTKEQFLEKYGDVPLKFSSYYKHTFVYRGFTKDETEVIVVNVDCDEDQAYHWEVDADELIDLECLIDSNCERVFISVYGNFYSHPLVYACEFEMAPFKEPKFRELI